MIRGAVYIIPASAVMGAVLFTLAKLEMVSVIGLITGLSGLLTIFAVYKLKNRGKKTASLYKDKLNLFQSVLPYILIVLLSVAFFILDPKWVIELDFPGYTTGLGQIVEAEEAVAAAKAAEDAAAAEAAAGASCSLPTTTQEEK